jgi:hypothetical protein
VRLPLRWGSELVVPVGAAQQLGVEAAIAAFSTVPVSSRSSWSKWMTDSMNRIETLRWREKKSTL